MNKATLYGRLAHTPELKSLPNGTMVANMSLATSHVYYDANKQKVEETDWHNLVCFGKMAENIGKYCEGGQQMLFTGRIVKRTWDDKTTGEKKHRTEIIVDSFEFGAKSQARADKQAAATNTPPVEVQGQGYNGEVANPPVDDSIPF